MDYCYTCQRILNGVLVCPGCGAYATEAESTAAMAGGPHDGAYPTGHLRRTEPSGFQPAGYSAAPAPLPEYVPTGYADPAPYTSTGFSPAAAAETEEEPAAESVLGPASIAPTLHRGRAARRRQMARWKKSRRRAGVATAFALFSGGVTVASMHAHGKGGATTASSDTVAPVNLRTQTSQDGGPSSVSPQQAGTPAHHATASQQRNAAGTPSHPTAQATHTVTDNAGAVRISDGSPTGQTSVQHSRTPQTSTTTAPTTGDSGTGTGGSTGTSGSTGTTTTGGSTGTTGGGTTATSPPTGSTPSTPPTTTSPTTPAPQQGLCILILCIG